MTAAAPVTEEHAGRRRHFRLPAEDEAYLDKAGFEWETVIEGAVHRLVIYGFRVPEGYNLASVDLALRIEQLYPDTQIDMVYFHPALQKTSGGAIKAISTESFDNKQWQRWSRHRTPQNPWRPDVDCVETHLELVRYWLNRELP